MASIAFAQTYQLTVQNGYGSGQYMAGDSVHIWAKEWPVFKTFDEWTGQSSFLEMPDEWHTRVIMPDHDVMVTAETRNLPAGADFTQENIMGRDTIQNVYTYFPPGGPPKGVVWLFHGTNGSAEGWVNLNIEQRLFANYLMADSLGVIVTECEERTRNDDISGDGNIRWQYTFDSIENVDIANIRAIRDTFINRGAMNVSTPQIAAGFSAGGAFSTLVAPALKWKAAVCHNARGVQPVIDITNTPILFSMSLFDSHPDVGQQGNMDAFANYQYLIGKGYCSRFYMLRPSPVYPQRFMRIPGVSEVVSHGIYDELLNNNCLNAKHFLSKPPGEINALADANPQNWPTLTSLIIPWRNFVSDELSVMWTAHHFHTDFCAKDLEFINQACGTSVATHDPINEGVLKIFPNPANQEISVSAPCDLMRAYNLEGQLVLSKTMAGVTTVDVSFLPAGPYFLEILAQRSHQVVKFIKY